MDFRWSQEEEALYNRYLKFARENLTSWRDRDEFDWFSRQDWQRCGEAGLLGLSVPAAYGGQGHGSLTTARAVEAFGQGCDDMGLVFSACAHLFACLMPIVEYGDEAMKGELLPRLCNGQWVGANAITEPEAGSDIFALKSQAVKQGEGYVLSGSKNYVTNGPAADIFVVYAMTNPSHGYLGVSAFVVEKERAGLTVGPHFRKMGLNSTPVCAITMEDCYVPARNRIGAEGQGARVFQSSMQWERACLFAGYLGMMARQLDQAIGYARTRRQFGKPIGKNQGISHRVADMKLRLEAARLLLYRACWLFDQGQNSVLDVSLSKLAVSEWAIQSSLDAIQIHGGRGYAAEDGIERDLRNAIPSTIFSGTSEIQRDLIARELGL